MGPEARLRHRRGIPLVACLALALALLAPARAAVRVEPADDRAAPLARALAADAPFLLARAAGRLGLPEPSDVLVLVASSSAKSGEIPRLGRVPHWAAGVAEPGRARIVLFADRLGVAGHDDVRGALAHEAAHLVLGAALPPGAHVPRWYDEGVAMTVERTVSLGDALELARMTVVGSPPPLSTLDRGWPASTAGARAAYAQSLDFVTHASLAARPGAPGRLVAALREGADFERAFAVAYSAPLAALEADWRRGLRERYVLVPIVVAGTVANVVLGVLAFVAAVTVRRRRQRALDAMGDDAAEGEEGIIAP